MQWIFIVITQPIQLLSADSFQAIHSLQMRYKVHVFLQFILNKTRNKFKMSVQFKHTHKHTKKKQLLIKLKYTK